MSIEVAIACVDPDIYFRWWWGGGGGSPDGRKQPEQHCFCYQLNYRGGPLDLCQRKLYFSKDPEGAQHFPHFFFLGGVQMLISIETHTTFDFLGSWGVWTPIPPLDLHMEKCSKYIT